MTPDEARRRAEATINYADSLPDEWLPGELDLHRQRMEHEPGYADAPVYVRPPHFICSRCKEVIWDADDITSGYCCNCLEITEKH